MIYLKELSRVQSVSIICIVFQHRSFRRDYVTGSKRLARKYTLMENEARNGR